VTGLLAGPGTARRPASALAPLAAQKVGSNRLTGTVMYDRYAREC
jgi:hypothetical protein